MSQLAIRAMNLGKRYRIGSTERFGLRRTFREALARTAAGLIPGLRRSGNGAQDPTIWALKDVSFEVGHGEVVGIIGKNGAGKSTLLKVLSRITSPTEGLAEIRGRLGCLLEVGTGFHSELTGRENIYLNGAILGMRRAEIDERFDEIVEFSEVGKFLDTPVKHYSTGMNMRLAFAVAAHLNPEILVIDEVLAVGDASFQKKCLGKMDEVARAGRTVLFVSHNMNAVVNLCSRALWLSAGKIVEIGDPAEVVGKYLISGETFRWLEEFGQIPTASGPDVRILQGAISPQQSMLYNGTPLEIAFRFQARRAVECNFCFYAYREGSLAFVSSDFHRPLVPGALKPGAAMEVSWKVPPYLLNPGFHSFGCAIVDRGGNHRQYASVQEILPCQIEDDQYRRGGTYLLGWGGAVSPILDASCREVAA